MVVDSPTDTIRVEERQLGDATTVWVTLNRPNRLNALTPEQTADFVDIFASFEPDTADAVVVTGAGDDFCTGADVSRLDPGGDGGFEAGRMQELVDSLRECPLPVVARVQGRAFGAGFMLCLGSDVVVAAPDAQFGLQEVKLGMPVEGYVTTLLPRIIGELRAREWLLTGAVVSADRAKEAGLVSRVVSVDDIDDEVGSFVSQFAENSTAAIATLKERMADPTAAHSRSAVREEERDALRRAYESPEVRERIEELLNS